MEKYVIFIVVFSFVSYLSKFSNLLHMFEFNTGTLLGFSAWQVMCIFIATNIKFCSNATTTSDVKVIKYCFANSSLLS